MESEKSYNEELFYITFFLNNIWVLLRIVVKKVSCVSVAMKRYIGLHIIYEVFFFQCF